jgi:MFS transporter, DHA1 family, tetracycline resistance protein
MRNLPLPICAVMQTGMTAATESMPPAVKFVLAVIFINAVGFGIAMPVMPALVMELSGGGIAFATAIGGWMAFTYAIAQFLFSPVLGNLSDKIGRRPVLLATIGGFAIDFAILAIAPTLVWVFVIRFVSGVFGASNAPAQSVIADVTPPEHRARYFGYISAAFGAGFVLGPAIGGLLGEFDHRIPFLVTAALGAVMFVWGWFRLPETLPPERRRAFDWRRANPVGALMQARALTGLGAVSVAYLLWQVATLVYPMTWSYFTIGRYGWSERLVGLSLAGVGGTMVLVQLFVLPRAVARFGESGAAIFGVAGSALAMFGFAAATQGWMIFALFPLMALQSIVHPNLTAMLSRRADATTQGEIQGYASSLMAVGSLIAPLVFNPLQSAFTAPAAPVQIPGIAYIVAGMIAVVCLPLLMVVRRQQISPPAGEGLGVS